MNRIHDSRELRRHIIAFGIYHPAMVTLGEVGHYLSVSGDGLHFSMLVIAHEAAIPLYISAEDCCQLSLCMVLAHRINSPSTKKPPDGYSHPLEAYFAPPSGDLFMASSKKVGVMLLNLLKLGGMNALHSN
jgi:hypothetical protein